MDHQHNYIKLSYKWVPGKIKEELYWCDFCGSILIKKIQNKEVISSEPRIPFYLTDTQSK